MTTRRIPKPRDLAPLMKFEQPFRGRAGRLARARTIWDLRGLARRRTPKVAEVCQGPLFPAAGRAGWNYDSAMATTEIATGAPVATLINVFTCAPDRQEELLREWTRHTEETMQHQPGFISANLHAGMDGRKVINYAQWESEQHLRDVLANPDIQKELARLSEIAELTEPGFYRVVSVHHR